MCIYIVQHTEGHIHHRQSAKSSSRLFAKLISLSWRNSGLKDTWQWLESSLSHLIGGENDCGVQVLQLDGLSCSVHCHFLPEIITKPYWPTVMTTRMNFSSSSLSASSYFLPASSLCIYHVISILSSKINALWAGQRRGLVPACPHCI